VSRAYHATAPHLLGPDRQAELGRALYRWLDGPAHRWLDAILSRRQPTTLRIDVEQHLRHLPWELLFADGGFLCQRSAGALNVVRHASKRAPDAPPTPSNRPLRILFLASSPKGVLPLLDFEQEEGAILQATQRQPIELVVEESGSLAGLRERIASHAPGYFDVLHLTGHATIEGRDPVFLAEDELGGPDPVTTDRLAEALGERWPRLVFVSACRTGQAPDGGELPSLCEALVDRGANAVLGWGLPVDDTAATAAAAALYESLAIGDALDAAFAKARKALLTQKSPYWHLLRGYADATPSRWPKPRSTTTFAPR
jgi:CHAT domain-containing protein